MIYAVLSGCNSLREMSGIILACEDRVNHPGIKYFPIRSAINDYQQWLQWTLEGIYFVTRQKRNAVWQSIEEYDIPEGADNGILKDEKIKVSKNEKTIELRRIAYWEDEQKKYNEFITNNYDIPAEKIAAIYKMRWQIELLFKRLKQNFPLKYFLGDSQNAIEIHIWTSLIVQLLLLVIQRQAQRKRAFSNMASVIRFHLMTYIDLLRFLNSPDSDWSYLSNKNEYRLLLFDSS